MAFIFENEKPLSRNVDEQPQLLSAVCFVLPARHWRKQLRGFAVDARGSECYKCRQVETRFRLFRTLRSGKEATSWTGEIF